MGKKSPVALFAELGPSASPWARKKRGFCARVALARANIERRDEYSWILAGDGHISPRPLTFCIGA